MRKKKTEELFPNYQVILELISYNAEQHEKFDQNTVDELLVKLKKDRVNWINLDGLSSPGIIEKLQNHFSFHSLVIEDILNDQRPKSEEYEDYLFFTLKMLYSIEGDKIEYEQISFVLGPNYLISFQEKAGDLFDPFRERIRLDQGRARKKKSDYLLYRLIDIIVDHYYVILDNIGDQIEEIVFEGRVGSGEAAFGGDFEMDLGIVDEFFQVVDEDVDCVAGNQADIQNGMRLRGNYIAAKAGLEDGGSDGVAHH